MPAKPDVGLHAWGLACGFMLSEIELCGLTASKKCISVDHERSSVTLFLSVSKTDPLGRGARRTRTCTCGLKGLPSCPFCSAVFTLKQLSRRWAGITAPRRGSLIPLISTIRSKLEFADKARCISALRADARRLIFAGHVDPSSLSGHSFRRSGAKYLARRGHAIGHIQWLGRWGSAAVLGYVEDAAEEFDPFACESSRTGQSSLQQPAQQVYILNTDTSCLHVAKFESDSMVEWKYGVWLGMEGGCCACEADFFRCLFAPRCGDLQAMPAGGCHCASWRNCRSAGGCRARSSVNRARPRALEV